MSDAAPKPWVKALRIKSTPWRVLVGLWGHGSYKADGPAFVWVNRRKLADEIGLPLGTLRNGLDALAGLGWIVRDGGGWRLAWMTPGNFTRPADGPTRPTGEPARPQADPARGESDPARPQADPRPARGPHNVAVNFQLPSNQVGDASARPPTPCTCPQAGGLDLLGGMRLTTKPGCPRHDPDFTPPPSPEEHTHGDTPRPDQPASADEARAQHRDQAPGAGRDVRAGGGGVRPDHVQRSLTRATGAAPKPKPGGAGLVTGHPRHDGRGAGGHRGRGDGGGGTQRRAGGPMDVAAHVGSGRLSHELTKAVAAAGDAWGAQLGHQRFEQLVLECVDDLGLTPQELTKGLLGWETADRRSRPPRHEWLYSRNRRAFKAAAGLGEASTSGRKASAPASSSYDWSEDDLRADMRAGSC